MFNNKLIAQLNEQILQLNKDNSKLKLELDAQILNNQLLKKEYSDYYKLKASLDSINSVSDKLQSINDNIKSKQSELINLQSQINTIESANYIHTLGFFDLKNDSKYYQDELNANRAKQKLMLSNKTYFKVKEKWIINNSAKEGSKLLEFFVKICMSSYNLFCDNTIDKTNIVNQQYLKDRVKRIYDGYNKELSAHGVELSADYLELKLDEIDIRLKIYVAKENEKEEENRRKEVLREQIRAEAEIKKNREKLEKELLHYQIQLNKGADVQDKIDEIESKIETEDYMLANNRSGYVYIISNGSLGKDTYKIGITRRVSTFKGDDSPCAERINELSGSNIPFRFKPNCIIWADDCFKLESALHKEFDKYRVNKIKTHREFFKLPLSQIEKVVKEKYYPQAIFDYDMIDEDFIASGYMLSNNFIDK